MWYRKQQGACPLVYQLIPPNKTNGCASSLLKLCEILKEIGTGNKHLVFIATNVKCVMCHWQALHLRCAHFSWRTMKGRHNRPTRVNHNFNAARSVWSLVSADSSTTKALETNLAFKENLLYDQGHYGPCIAVCVCVFTCVNTLQMFSSLAQLNRLSVKRKPVKESYWHKRVDILRQLNILFYNSC